MAGDRSKTRRRWLWKNGFRRCYYCNMRLQWRGKHALTADHLIPRSRGGTDRRKNLVAACYPCNQAKGSKMPAALSVFTKKDPASQLRPAGS
ncbi:MAG: transporter [Bradyrhizobium sp.]|nr:transporter [Bradyrhizobium sp.]